MVVHFPNITQQPPLSRTRPYNQAHKCSPPTKHKNWTLVRLNEDYKLINITLGQILLPNEFILDQASTINELHKQNALFFRIYWISPQKISDHELNPSLLINEIQNFQSWELSGGSSGEEEQPMSNINFLPWGFAFLTGFSYFGSWPWVNISLLKSLAKSGQRLSFSFPFENFQRKTLLNTKGEEIVTLTRLWVATSQWLTGLPK